MPADTHSTPALRALKHGLRAQTLVVADEDPAEWRDFHDSVVDDLAPQTPLEHALAGRIAEVSWRMRRLARFEQTAIESDTRSAARHNRIVRQYEADYPPPPTRHIPQNIDLIVRYEAHLNRQLASLLKQLTLLQDRRRLAAAVEQQRVICDAVREAASAADSLTGASAPEPARQELEPSPAGFVPALDAPKTRKLPNRAREELDELRDIQEIIDEIARSKREDQQRQQHRPRAPDG